MTEGSTSAEPFAQTIAQVRLLPPNARGHVVAAKAALDTLAQKTEEPPFGWRQRAALVLFAGALGYGVVMGTLRWIDVEKATGWIEAAVPAACALIVAIVTFWPRRPRNTACSSSAEGWSKWRPNSQTAGSTQPLSSGQAGTLFSSTINGMFRPPLAWAPVPTT